MRPLLSAEQMRQFDRHWMERGVASLILMENAGRGAAHLIGLKARPRAAGQPARSGSSVVGTCIRCADEKSLSGVSVVVLCGPGNNGGDGYVVGRHLLARAVNLRVFSTVPIEQLRDDALLQAQALLALGARIESAWGPDFTSALQDCDVLVDALLGTGVSRPVEGKLARLIEQVNASAPYVIALDVPSGLDATTGACWGPVLRAAHTVTFAHLKTGLLTTHGHDAGGNITVSHIGVPSTLPSTLEPLAWLLEESDIAARVPRRSQVLHKGEAGRVLVLAGSPGTLGAARLVSRAALRAGAGLVTLFNEASVIEHFSAEVAEVMTHASAQDCAAETDRALLERADSVVVGPGLGRSSYTRAAIAAALRAARPVVFDADALRCLAQAQGADLPTKEQGKWCVLTPHVAEAADLLRITTEQVEADRFSAATQLARDFGAVVLLKGSRPVLACPEQATLVSAFGSAALATGGSGDVLAGLLGALLVGATSQAEIFSRVIAAVGLQGLAAEQWEQQHGARGLLASEVADLVPSVLQRLLG